MEDIESLKQELFAPVRTIRLFAIESVLRAKNSKAILSLLVDRLKIEDDPECQLLLQHAINNTKLYLSSNSIQNTKASNNIYNKFFSRQPSLQLEVIDILTDNDITNENSKLTLTILLENSSHPVVTAHIFKKFCRLIPTNKIAFLKKNLFHESISLRLACLEVLATVYPAELKDSFAKLVLSKEPVIRALAIRGLAKTSPLFASDFLAEFLDKGDIYGKLAAMRVCSVIDFALIKNSVLNILIKETDSKLLKIASSIILTNPDKEMPFRLYDLLEKVSNSKKSYINNILKNYCNILKATGICEDYDKYILNLRQYVTNSQKKNFVINLLESYASSSEEKKLTIIKLLSRKIEVEPTINDYIKNWKLHNSESDFTLETQATSSINSSITQTDSEAQNNTIDDLETLPIEEQQKRLQDILTSKQYKAEVKGVAFHFAITNNLSTFTKEANDCINLGNDELTAAAFEYLSIFDKESFLLKMRKFATSDSILIRTVLISKACKDFPDDAKSLLNSMLSSSIVITRKKALGAIIHFEFSFIKPLLIRFLKRETNKELFVICLGFFQSNPLIESLYDLQQIGNKSKHKPLFTDAIEHLRKTLTFLNIVTENEIELYIVEREKQEENLIIQKQQNQQLEKLKMRIKWATASELNEDGQLTKILFALTLLFGIILGTVYFSGDNPPKQSSSNKVVFKPLLANIEEFQVTVLKVNSNQTILVSDQQGRKLRLSPRAGREFSVFIGDQFTLTGMPHKIDSNGILSVKTLKLIRK